MYLCNLNQRLSQSPDIPTSTLRILRHTAQSILLCCSALLLILWVGAEYEDYQVRNAPSMDPFYQDSAVCGLINNYTLQAETFPTVQAARDAGISVIAHCGECGQCSTPPDIRIYDQTQHTLHGISANCAKRGLIGGRQAAATCMQDNVGFSPGCNECWVDNIACDLRKCVFTCLWQDLFYGESNGKDGQKLNRCTACDEMLCGPQFLTCAGANRRRTGIISDMARDPTSVCSRVHPHGWWKDPVLQVEWKLGHAQHQSIPQAFTALQQVHFVRSSPAHRGR